MPVIADSRMHLGQFEFTVVRAEFCHIDRDLEPGTWDLNIYGHCVNDDDDEPVFPGGLMLSAQGIPLTLSRYGDFTGFALHTPSAAYCDSGQSYFALWIDSEYETWDVDFRLVERNGELYLLKFQAMTNFGNSQLRISAWVEEVESRSQPKTDYPMWLKPRSRK
jgi:hypothetical protein